MATADSFVSYRAPEVEPVINREEELISQLSDTISRVIDRNFSKHCHVFRGTHVKTQAIVKGELTVLPDLPSHLAHGAFSPSNASTSHPVALRFANEPSFLQDDRAPGPRGCAMKVFNVQSSSSEGWLDPVGEQTHSQDFTFNNAPMLELTDLPTAVEIFATREKHFDDPEALKQAIEQRDDSELQLAPQGLPNQHMASYVMYSQSAFRWGPHIAKYALFPTSETQKKLESLKIDASSAPEQHSLWLKDFFASNAATYDFRVQLCRDIAKQSVEDTSKPWDEDEFPFETVGNLVLPAGQDAFDPARRTFWEDKLRLNVWYGLQEHRPLGSVNRLRKRIYQTSQRKRATGNAVRVVDVKSVDEIP